MSPRRITEYREAFGGRRFLLTVGAGIVNTALRVFDFIDQATYSNLTLWTVAAYITGATAQKFSSRGPRDGDPKSNDSVP